MKERARIESTFFKAKWEVVPVKLAALIKRNFVYETFSSNFLRSRSFDVLRAAISDLSKIYERCMYT